MSIWDAIGNGLEFGKTEDNKGKPLLATTFTANFGDTINTLMGGGRFTNLIGSDAKVVFDWEEALKDGLSKLPMIGKGVGGFLEGKAVSAFMGLGGDTSLVYGNKTAFHYSGKAFTSRRGGTPSAEFKDTNNDNAYYIGKRRAVYLALLTGIAAIVALSVTVRLKYSNFAINKDKPDLVKGEEKTEEEQAKEQADEKNTELAKNLICGFFVICEDRWLLFLRDFDIKISLGALLQAFTDSEKDTLDKAEKDAEKALNIVQGLTAPSATQIREAYAKYTEARADALTLYQERIAKKTKELSDAAMW